MNKPYRKSVRLKGYDYSQTGYYFVTICIRISKCILGEVVKGEMRLSAVGVMAKKCWLKIPEHFSGTELDEFIVMPNHVHGIIFISNQVLENSGVQVGRGVQLNAPTDRLDIR